MPHQKFSLFVILLINFISLIISQFENDSMSKAIACMSVISQKYKGKEPDPSIYSTMMLKCFITIKDSQSKKLLLGIETGSGSLSKSEIDKLTDYESLKDMNPNELRKKSQELEKAIKGFKKLQDEFTGGMRDSDSGDYDEDDYDDEGFSGKSPSRINFFSLIPKGIFGFFNVFNNYLSLFLVFIILYFGLLMLRKINDSERKMNKKKRMIMKRVKEEYDEDDDEEEEEENEQEIEEKIKKIKKGKNKKIK